MQEGKRKTPAWHERRVDRAEGAEEGQEKTVEQALYLPDAGRVVGGKGAL